jgi:predicted dehydrogenase
MYRVAVIGRTGKGNYGHSLDTSWKTYPGVEIVAVADENPDGLKKAGERLGTRALYTSYSKMLAAEKPAFVVIGPRWIDQHLEMVLACAEAHSHIFMEKPMARTPAECDRMIDACDRAHVKMSVAHNMRVCPIVDFAERRVKEGIIGEVQELRGRGKEDKRAGGEDLMVLGTHVFDLMRRFAGDPHWALGRVSVKGREARHEDVIRDGPEGMGPVAGDQIEGMFGFGGGVTGYFGSKLNSDTSGKRFGLSIYGSRGVMVIPGAHVPEIQVMESSTWTGAPWKRIEIPAGTGPRDLQSAYHLMIADQLQAVENDTEPVSGGRNARWTIEMAMSLYESHKRGGRVRLPLEKREHPLL